jgi:uncharacterized protein YegP (UPF0339 family)
MRTVTRWALLSTLAVVLLVVSGSGIETAAQDKAKAKVDAAVELSFEIYKDKGGKFRWRLHAGEKEIAMSPRGYDDKAEVKGAIDQIIKGAAKAKVVDGTPTKTN